MINAVFAMQGIGQLVGGLVLLIAVAGFQSSMNVDSKSCHGDCVAAADKIWRIVIGFGAVPACFALYCRSPTAPESSLV